MHTALAKASELQWKQSSCLFSLTCFTGGVTVVAWGLRGCWLFSFCACSCSLANFCFSSRVSEAFKRESTGSKLQKMLILTFIFLFHTSTAVLIICGKYNYLHKRERQKVKSTIIFTVLLESTSSK